MNIIWILYWLFTLNLADALRTAWRGKTKKPYDKWWWYYHIVKWYQTFAPYIFLAIKFFKRVGITWISVIAFSLFALLCNMIWRKINGRPPFKKKKKVVDVSPDVCVD